MLDNVLIRASLLRNAMPAQSGKLKKTVEFENFISEHECPINHTGSAGSMEAKGVVECFHSSVENRKLQYTKLIGDGDSKIHTSIVTADPYPGVKVKKLECIGHTQKSWIETS